MTVPPIGSDLVAFTDVQFRENEAHLSALVEVIASGEAVAIVGAGSSISAGYDGWWDLLSRLARVAEDCKPGFTVAPRPSGETPLAYARAIRDCIIDARGREYFDDEVARIFAQMPDLKQFHDDLVALPFRGFVTTNYEHTLEHTALTSGRVVARPTPVPVWRASGRLVGLAIRALSEGPRLSHVLHLHGCYDQPATVVLCDDDYGSAYGFAGGSNASPSGNGGPPKLWTVLTALLTMRRVVFVGFSLDDPFVTEVLNRIARALWEWDSAVHYALLPITAATAPADRLKAERIKRELGIETVFYEVHGVDHSERDAIVARIRTDIERRRGATPTVVVSPIRSASQLGTAHAPTVPPWVSANNAAQRARIAQREE